MCVAHLQDTSGPAYYAHAVVDEVLAGQPPEARLPAAPRRWPRLLAPVLGLFGLLAGTARLLARLTFRQKASTQHSPSLNKLALLLLGFGRQPAVVWAQQLLGVQPADGRRIFYLGVLHDNVMSLPVEQLGEEHMLSSSLGRVYNEEGRYAVAERFYRCVFRGQDRQ